MRFSSSVMRAAPWSEVVPLAPAFGPVLDESVKSGWLRADGTRYALTETGFLFADRIARAILEAGGLLDRIEGTSPKSGG